METKVKKGIQDSAKKERWASKVVMGAKEIGEKKASVERMPWLVKSAAMFLGHPGILENQAHEASKETKEILAY